MMHDILTALGWLAVLATFAGFGLLWYFWPMPQPLGGVVADVIAADPPKRTAQVLPFSRHYAPSRDEFAAWIADPTTAFVYQALRNAAAENERAWKDASWISGKCDPLLLMELRTRADAYMAIEEATYERLCELAGVEPEPEPQEDDAA